MTYRYGNLITKFRTFSKNEIISFKLTEHKSPRGSPVKRPATEQKRPATTKENETDFPLAPMLFKIAISLRRSITSITRAAEIFMEATRTIKIITK